MRREIINWRSNSQRLRMVGEICEDGCGARVFPPRDLCLACNLPIQAEGVLVSSKTGFRPVALTNKQRESWRQYEETLELHDKLYEDFREGRIDWIGYLAVVYPKNRR